MLREMAGYAVFPKHSGFPYLALFSQQETLRGWYYFQGTDLETEAHPGGG